MLDELALECVLIKLKTNGGADVLHGGFTCEQWAGYARKKSGFANRLCKENGPLKARLAELGSISKEKVDLLMASDQWHN